MSSTTMDDDPPPTHSELVIETPEQLQTNFGKILSSNGLLSDGLVVEISPLLQAAILSSVYEVTVTPTSANHDTNDTLPLVFIAKFLKSTLPLQDMFAVEGIFYRDYAKKLEQAVDELYIPTALYCGRKCIVLSKVTDTTCYTLLESCPVTQLSLVLSVLAGIHAHFWNTPLEGLSSTAGIGTAMSGQEKERTFPTLWKPFVESIPDLVVENRTRLVEICEDLSRRRISDVHARTHEHQPTLIHGDFHVGNLLFHSSDDHDNDRNITVLDWATSGRGNNMVDVVFFWLVSTRLTIQEMVNKWLPFYYNALLKHDDKVVDYSWETCVFDFRTCLLNQFIVLVCYDEISKTLLDQEVNSEQARRHFERHFSNVNTRCAKALLSEEMNLMEYPLPSYKTENEQEQSASGGVGEDVGGDDVIRRL